MPCGCVLAFYASLPFIGTAPAVVQFEQEWWVNESWGFHAIRGNRASGTIAVSRTGSRLNRIEGAAYRYHFWPEGQWNADLLYDAATDSSWSKNRDTGEVYGRPCQCSWDKSVDRSPQCEVTARRWFGERTVRARDGSVAGQPVVRWRVRDADEEAETALAPGLGCEVMELVRTTFGKFGIPASRSRFVVTAYKAGEPDAAYFRVPQK